MQQALYNHIGISHPAAATGTTQRKTAVVRWIARRWELAGVLTLIGSSAAYSVFALGTPKLIVSAPALLRRAMAQGCVAAWTSSGGSGLPALPARERNSRSTMYTPHQIGSCPAPAPPLGGLRSLGPPQKTEKIVR